jgi:hypothetical protein
MPNPHLIQRLAGIQQALMAQHLGGHGLPNAVVGDERETFLREFLQKVFPAHRRFATGVITDSQDRISGQVDIAVEFPFTPSFPMPGNDQRLLLAECVAIAIEVKSDLVGQWQQVRDTTRQIKLLQRQLNPIMVLGQVPGPAIPCVAVGYTGHATVDGLANRLVTTPEAERPDAALVINSGCFVGFGIQAAGALGLYALCIAINSLLISLGAASPNLIAYVEA